MHRIAGFLVALVITTTTTLATAQQRYPSARWDVASSPEALGYSSDRLQEAEAYTRGIKTTAVMIVVDGVVLDQSG